MFSVVSRARNGALLFELGFISFGRVYLALVLGISIIFIFMCFNLTNMLSSDMFSSKSRLLDYLIDLSGSQSINKLL